jgi:hypothetical protein
MVVPGNVEQQLAQHHHHHQQLMAIREVVMLVVEGRMEGGREEGGSFGECSVKMKQQKQELQEVVVEMGSWCVEAARQLLKAVHVVTMGCST